MGNSPSTSKNESSQSQQTASSPSGGSGEALEPDPRSPPSHSKRLVASSIASGKKHLLPNTNINSTGKSGSPKENAPSSFDLQIATSMAFALNINKSNISSSSDEAASSSVGSDLSLLAGSSISSISSLPPNSVPKNLEPIDEASVEGSHEPSKSRKKKNRKTSASSSSDELDIDAIIESLIETGLSRSFSKKLPVTSTQIQEICARAREIFLSQPMLLELAAPVKVVGDLHGQFYDLLRILKLCGFPPRSNYLFLGDYVDRGKQSLETLLLLLSFKIKYPENFFMLRGNHECASITKMYGFYDECKRRSSVKNWKCFVDVFNTLPVVATIGDKIFCVHGGLSPHLQNFNQINKIARPTDVPDDGLLSDLLWSDPDSLTTAWSDNDRGVSFTFGAEIVSSFLKKHNMDLIVRAHMVVEDGYEFFAKRKLVTVFSAPNYCGEFDNWGAVMNVNKNLVCSFEMLKPAEKMQVQSNGSDSRN